MVVSTVFQTANVCIVHPNGIENIILHVLLITNATYLLNNQRQQCVIAVTVNKKLIRPCTYRRVFGNK